MLRFDEGILCEVSEGNSFVTNVMRRASEAIFFDNGRDKGNLYSLRYVYIFAIIETTYVQQEASYLIFLLHRLLHDVRCGLSVDFSSPLTERVKLDICLVQRE